MGHEKIKNLQQPRLKQTAFVPKKNFIPTNKTKKKDSILKKHEPVKGIEF